MKKGLVLADVPTPRLSTTEKLGKFKNMGVRLRCEPNKVLILDARLTGSDSASAVR